LFFLSYYISLLTLYSSSKGCAQYKVHDAEFA
jgi:hypothetical protein